MESGVAAPRVSSDEKQGRFDGPPARLRDAHATMSVIRGEPDLKRTFRFVAVWIESRCGAVALGRTYLLPPLSSGGASMVPPWLRFHIPLIEPDRQISRIRLSDKTSRFRVQRHLQLLNIYWS
jgi:hypothetical protein